MTLSEESGSQPLTKTSAFVFFRLLADRNLKPSALALEFGGGDADMLLPTVTGASFCALAAAIPCVIGEGAAGSVAPELLQTLAAADCQVMPQAAIHSTDQRVRPDLPAACNWLGGNWYLAPPVHVSASQAASRTLALKLLKLVAADAETRAIEAVFRQDPVLAYHLVRLVNSLGAGAGIGRPISSFSQAIVFLGRQQLKRWLNLMLFAANRDDYRSAMLMARVAVRARSVELLAKAVGLDRTAQEHAFMAGMFSLLGVLFGSPLADILEMLQLNSSVKDAALKRAGRIGRLLLAVELGEGCDSDGLGAILADVGLSPARYMAIAIEAHQWMLQVIRGDEEAADD
jgi:EAL and modified HD-GYP domain-containing signal transduction protein